MSLTLILLVSFALLCNILVAKGEIEISFNPSNVTVYMSDTEVLEYRVLKIGNHTLFLFLDKVCYLGFNSRIT